MRIVFMGTPDFAAAFLRHLLKGPHEVVAVATQPDRPAGRGRQLQPPPVKEEALKAGLRVLQPASVKDESFAEELKTLQADLFVVVAYSILPKAVLAASRLGAVNLHGSLLPRYRGAAPVQWAIANGDKQSGVTVFLLDEKMDHGPVLEQRAVEISSDDTTESLLEKLVAPGCEAIDSALNKLDTCYTPVAQDHSLACPAPKLRKEDGLVDWARPAQSIHDRIRAFTPWPGGYTYFQGKLAYLRRTEVSEKDHGLALGVIHVEKERWLVGTGEGTLVLLEIQMEGKKCLPVADFLRGLQQRDGLCFSGALL